MEQPPLYKVAYQKCSIPGLHQGEDRNIVCLNAQCETSVVCSFCKSQKHQNHNTKTLKKYIQNAVTTINTQSTDFSDEQIEERKNEFLNILKQVINDLATKFRQIEKMIVQMFSKAKQNNILKIKSKQQFMELYSKISNSEKINPSLLIQKYSNCNFKLNLPNPQQLKDMSYLLNTKLQQAFSYYKTISKKESQIIPLLEQSSLMKIILTPNTTFNNNIVTQTKQYSTNIVLLSDGTTPQISKLKLDIIQKPERLFIGIMTMPSYTKHYKGKIFDPFHYDKNCSAWICSKGFSSKCTNNSISQIEQNQTLFLTLRKDQMVIKKRDTKDHAIFSTIFPSKEKRYFFIAMQGEGKVELGDYKYSNKN